MPPRRSMETNAIEYGNFFEGEARFIVPKFQRNYNWESDHVDEFWNDLMKHWTDWKDRRDRTPYYFGSMMLVNEDETNFSFRIVDGQQRMTTSMIFFIALRDYFLEMKYEDDVDDLNSIIYYQDESFKLTPRLLLNRYNNEYFQSKMIEQKNLSEKINSIGRDVQVKNKKLANCYKEIATRLIDKDKEAFGPISLEDKIKDIRDMYQHFLKNFEVVENIFSSKQRAYRIFETINHKGLRLDENDLVKNYLMELIDDTHSVEEPQDVINADDKWGEIINKLEHIRMKEDTLLRIHLTAYVGKTPKDRIYDTVIEEVKGKAGAQEFLIDLEKSANFLSRIKKPTPQEWNSDQEVLDNLVGLDALSDGGMYPILLAAQRRLGVPELKKLIGLVTKLHFRAKTVCNVSYTDIEALVVKICTQLKSSTSGYSLPDIIQDILLWPKYPPTDEFEVKFKQLELSSTPKARYVLKEIEYDILGGRSISSTQIIPDIQVEHIMPKEIDGDWNDELGCKPELDSAAKISDYHKRNLFRLGNLTLLSPRANAIIQNDSYKKKLGGSGAYTGYRDDQIKMTSRLMEYQQWGEEEIGNRQNGFFLRAKKIWDLKLS